MLVFGPATVCHKSMRSHSDDGARVRRATSFYTDDDDRLLADAPCAGLRTSTLSGC